MNKQCIKSYEIVEKNNIDFFKQFISDFGAHVAKNYPLDSYLWNIIFNLVKSWKFNIHPRVNIDIYEENFYFNSRENILEILKKNPEGLSNKNIKTMLIENYNDNISEKDLNSLLHYMSKSQKIINRYCRGYYKI